MSNVDIAACRQAERKKNWSATVMGADEGNTAVAAAENNVRPEGTRATSSDIGGLAVKAPGAS
jgi:hypothetical protein